MISYCSFSSAQTENLQTCNGFPASRAFLISVCHPVSSLSFWHHLIRVVAHGHLMLLSQCCPSWPLLAASLFFFLKNSQCMLCCLFIFTLKFHIHAPLVSESLSYMISLNGFVLSATQEVEETLCCWNSHLRCHQPFQFQTLILVL